MKNRIMIVGGGTGGTIVANLLARKLRREIASGQVELVLISESPVHYYKPAFMYVAFNLFHHHELARPERQLLSPEIRFITDKIEAFDFKQRRLYGASKHYYDWDLLVIATGCTPFPQKIPGLAEAGDHFYQYAAARQLAH